MKHQSLGAYISGPNFQKWKDSGGTEVFTKDDHDASSQGGEQPGSVVAPEPGSWGGPKPRRGGFGSRGERGGVAS
jgi:hypothetical protein